MINSSKQRGLTLIEVLAAIALLSVLLVSLLTSYRKLAVQFQQANDRTRAIRAADRLMAEWSTGETIEVPDLGGRVEGEAALRWHVTGRSDPNLDAMGIQIATLTMWHRDAEADENPLVSLEFLTTSAVAQEE